MTVVDIQNEYISSDGDDACNCNFISKCFEGLKLFDSSSVFGRCILSCYNPLQDWMKKNSDIIKLIIKILMHVVFNLILSAVDVGTDIYAATNHFR